MLRGDWEPFPRSCGRRWREAPDEGLAAFRLAARALTPTLSRKSGRAGILLLRRRFDVVLVVDRERSHQHSEALGPRRILGDRVFAHPPGLELRALLGLEGAGREQVRGVIGEIAEIDEAPQSELRRTAVLGVGEHFGRHAKPADLDL